MGNFSISRFAMFIVILSKWVHVILGGIGIAIAGYGVVAYVIHGKELRYLFMTAVGLSLVQVGMLIYMYFLYDLLVVSTNP
jgi:hypothetical protein